MRRVRNTCSIPCAALRVSLTPHLDDSSIECAGGTTLHQPAPPARPTHKVRRATTVGTGPLHLPDCGAFHASKAASHACHSRGPRQMAPETRVPRYGIPQGPALHHRPPHACHLGRYPSTCRCGCPRPRLQARPLLQSRAIHPAEDQTPMPVPELKGAQDKPKQVSDVTPHAGPQPSIPAPAVPDPAHCSASLCTLRPSRARANPREPRPRP